jgi:hypothetical protein
MKPFSMLPLLSSLSLVLFVSCPAGLCQASGSYDMNDNSGDLGHTNETITGQVHDNMAYNWNTGTGTGNSQSGSDGGPTVQNYFGYTTQQQPPNLNPATQGLLSGTNSNYPFANTSFTYPLTYGFNQKGTHLKRRYVAPMVAILASSLGITLGDAWALYGSEFSRQQNGYGLYKGVDYYREAMNGNLFLNSAIPTQLNPTGTGAVNLNTVDPSSYGAAAAGFGLGSIFDGLGAVLGFVSDMAGGFDGGFSGGDAGDDGANYGPGNGGDNNSNNGGDNNSNNGGDNNSNNGGDNNSNNGGDNNSNNGGDNNSNNGGDNNSNNGGDNNSNNGGDNSGYSGGGGDFGGGGSSGSW